MAAQDFEVCSLSCASRLRSASIVDKITSQSGVGLNGVLMSKDQAFDATSARKWTSRSFKTAMESSCVLELQKRTQQDVAILMSFSDRPSMPGSIAVDHSSLPDSDFQHVATFEVTSKQIVAANQGKLNEVCVILKLEKVSLIQRFLRLRLIGHQSSRAKPPSTRASNAGNSKAHAVQALLVTTAASMEQSKSTSSSANRRLSRPVSAQLMRPPRPSMPGPAPNQKDLQAADTAQIAALHTPRALRPPTSSATNIAFNAKSALPLISTSLKLPLSKLKENDPEPKQRALSARSHSQQANGIKRPGSAGKPPANLAPEGNRRFSMLPMSQSRKPPAHRSNAAQIKSGPNNIAIPFPPMSHCEESLLPALGELNHFDLPSSVEQLADSGVAPPRSALKDNQGSMTRSRTRQLSQGKKAPAMSFLDRTEAQLGALTLENKPVAAEPTCDIQHEAIVDGLSRLDLQVPAHSSRKSQPMRSLAMMSKIATSSINEVVEDVVGSQTVTNPREERSSMPSLADLQAQIDATAKLTQALLARPIKARFTPSPLPSKELQELLSTSATLASHSSQRIATDSQLELLRKTQEEMEAIASRLGSRASSKSSSRASSRRVSCIGGVSRKLPDLSVAVGKVLKASREARPRQSLAAWPAGLVQHAKEVAAANASRPPRTAAKPMQAAKTQIHTPNSLHELSAELPGSISEQKPRQPPQTSRDTKAKNVVKPELSAAVNRLRQHQAASYQAGQIRKPFAENRSLNMLPSPREPNSKSFASEDQENVSLLVNSGSEAAVEKGSSPTPKTTQSAAKSPTSLSKKDMKSNPLWESFEGFKTRNASRGETPAIKKKALIPAAYSSPAGGLVPASPGLIATAQSPATPDFHSPGQFSPLPVLTTEIKAKPERPAATEEVTPEHLALEELAAADTPPAASPHNASDLQPQRIQFQPSGDFVPESPFPPMSLEKRSKDLKREKPAKKGNIFSRFLKASGLGPKDKSEEEILHAAGLTGDLTPDLRKGSFSRRRKKHSVKKEAAGRHEMSGVRTRSMRAKLDAQQSDAALFLSPAQ